MDASSLPIPDGAHNAKIIDGVRQIIQYDPATDGFIFRWDTIINGKQFHCIEYSTAWEGRFSATIEEKITKPYVDYLIDFLRGEAISKFQAIENHSTLVK